MTLVRHFSVIAGYVEHEEHVTQTLVREAAAPALLETCTPVHHAGLPRHTLTLTVAACGDGRVYPPAPGLANPAKLFEDLLAVGHSPGDFVQRFCGQ